MSDEIKKNTNNDSVSGEDLIDYELDKFVETIKPTEDEVTMILRAHLFAEYYLNKLIETEIPRGYFITKERISFPNKIAIVRALDVLAKEKEGIYSSLYELNNLRNRCAHVINYRISEDDVDKIGLPLGQHYTKLKFEFLKNLRGLLYRTLATLLIRDLAFVVNDRELKKCGKDMKWEQKKEEK